MLDFINNYFMYFTLCVCMAIEFSGLVHASYVLQIIVTKLAGREVESDEPPRDIAQNIFFWARCLFSTGVLVFALVVTITALFEDKTTMWTFIPSFIAVIVFFILMNVVGLLEGMQIAFFSMSKLDESQRGTSNMALKTCGLLFKGGEKSGNNLAGFMIGRQLCVVGCMFFVARVCTLNVEVGKDENVLGVPDGVQEFFNTGLLAALITTIIGSIAWQLVAAEFPHAFIRNPVVYFFLVWCLFLEGTGICDGAWVLARMTELVFRWKNDTEYHADIGKTMLNEKGAATGESEKKEDAATSNTSEV